MLHCVKRMISWKQSFGTLNEEYKTVRKKRQALDNLLSTGRISRPTYDMFSMEMAEAMTEIEKRQKALLQKMNAKIVELEEQVKTLEILLANYEIQHVTGEIDDETYHHEIDVLSMGLETSRMELNSVKEATGQLASGNVSANQENEAQAKEAGTPFETLEKEKVKLKDDQPYTTEAPEKELESAEAS
jgi:chromosome segregation ATPase